MKTPRRLAALGWILGAAACSGAGPPSPPSPAARTKIVAPRAPSPYPTPARWQVHPSPTSYVTAAVRLADGRCLVTEQNGQRWLTWPQRASSAPAPYPYDADWEDGDGPSPEYGLAGYDAAPCSGYGVAAADRAPEPIVGILRWPSSYAFIGASGTIHEAKFPLGRFVSRISPPEPLRRVRGAGPTILALSETGRVLRWAHEGGYQRADLGGVHAFDVAVSPDGHGVVLAAPEAIFTTEDGGVHFARAAAPSIGAQRVAWTPGGPFLIEGETGSLTWDPHADPPFVKSNAHPLEPRLDVTIQAGHTPSGDLVTSGRAAIDGARYWEVGISEESGWGLFTGRIDGRVTELPLPSSSSYQDSSYTIAARDRHVALGVFGWGDTGQTLEVKLSHDSARTFREGIALTPADQGGTVGLAVSIDGALLIAGACLRVEADPDRDPDGSGMHDDCAGRPLMVRDDGPPVAVRGPSLDGPAQAPAFSQDDRHAYFLAPRSRDSMLALFVSHDAGASFEERSLEIIEAGEKTTFEATPETMLTVSESGTVGVVLSALGEQSGTAYVTADADGRHVRMGTIPPGAAAIAGFGERALAVGQSDDGEHAMQAWESLDGGATWVDVPSPELLRDTYHRRDEMACGSAGCLIGGEVTRLGWGGQSDAPVPFEPVKKDAPAKTLRAAIACEPKAGSSWTRVDDVGSASVLPGEHEAARGRVAWMVPTLNRDDGSVSVVAATAPDSGDGDARITTTRLLGPLPKGAQAAISMRQQIEGVAVARVAVSSAMLAAGPGAWTGQRIKDLEIAWNNLEEGTTGHATLRDAGVYQRGTLTGVTGAGAVPAQLALQMLSVSPKGIFVRSTSAERTAYFLDTAGKAQAFTFPAWPPDFSGRELDAGDAVNVDGTFVLTSQLGYTEGGTEALFLGLPPSPAALPDAPWTPWAVTLAQSGDHQQRRYTTTDWTYEGGHLAVWAMHLVPDAGYAAAWSRRVLADGALAAPVRLPTPYDLPFTPRPCSAQEHRDLPRLKFTLDVYGSAAFPGTRHPVIVTEEGPPVAVAAAAPSKPTPRDVARAMGADLDGEGEGYEPTPTSKPKRGSTDERTPAGPAPIGHVALLTSGLILRGTPSSPCVDAFAARGAGDRTLPGGATPVSVLLTGDLRQGWYFRLAPAREPSKKGSPAPSPGRDIEVRPLACRFDPKVTVPDWLDYENRSR